MSTAVDTSALVPLLATWHEEHARITPIVRSEARLVPAHVLVEAMSVLTRLPAPHRMPPRVVANALRALPLQAIGLPADGYADLLDRAAEARVSGGALYDALIGVTSASHGARLLTLDQRAAQTYRALGVDYTLM